jgi:hypothetical protein
MLNWVKWPSSPGFMSHPNSGRTPIAGRWSQSEAQVEGQQVVAASSLNGTRYFADQLISTLGCTWPVNSRVGWTAQVSAESMPPPNAKPTGT